MSHFFLDKKNISLLHEMLHFTDLQGRIQFVTLLDLYPNTLMFVFRKKRIWENILESIHYYSISIGTCNHRMKKVGESLWKLPSPNPSSHSGGNWNRWLRAVSIQF